MNYILKCGKNFAAITNRVKADTHRYWMLQMFISSNENFVIQVNKKKIYCKGIIVDMDTIHMFNTGEDVNFTMLIDSTTHIGRMMRRQLLKKQSYYVFPDNIADIFQQKFHHAVISDRAADYIEFIRSTISEFHIDDIQDYDERIMKVIEYLDNCAYKDEKHQLEHLAEKVYLSKSRLAHLFKEQTGIPLKSYIILHKLHEAYDMIFDGASVTDAAMKVGFDSSAHFAYTNKKITGMSISNIIKNSVFLKVSM
jgi:AraC-like DNA-binding protein